MISRNCFKPLEVLFLMTMTVYKWTPKEIFLDHLTASGYRQLAQSKLKSIREITVSRASFWQGALKCQAGNNIEFQRYFLETLIIHII